jgi:hypothetical protein
VVRKSTFDFHLGFTHFCTRSRKWCSFVMGRKTIKKRMRAKLNAVKMELRKRMHDPIAKTGAWVKGARERPSVKAMRRVISYPIQCLETAP